MIIEQGIKEVSKPITENHHQRTTKQMQFLNRDLMAASLSSTWGSFQRSPGDGRLYQCASSLTNLEKGIMNI